MTESPRGMPAGTVPGEVRVVTLEFAQALASELDGARAELAKRTETLAAILEMKDPHNVTWTRAIAYARVVAHVAESHFGLPIEPNEDGTYGP
jgi:hypothetical protein